MKHRLTLLLFVLPIMIQSLAWSAEPEFRGSWVHNWLPGLLCQSQVDQTVRWAKDCNMNALVVQVRRLGDAYYRSMYEPRANNIQTGADFDPLASVVQQAHANGLEVHAWFNVYRVGSKTGLPPLVGHVGFKHPEWLSRNYNGGISSDDGWFLDPGVPEVRDHLVKIAAELVSNYDVDGLMLDYIRYPGKNWGYNSIAVARFNAEYNRSGKPSPDDPDWCSWRREQVTTTVRAISREVRRIKPWVKISAATIAWGNCPSKFEQTSAYKAVFQDWSGWAREGIIDANMLMNYKNPSSTSSNQSFEGWVAGAKKWSYGKHVYSGLMLFNDIHGTARQIELARKNGAEGVVGLAFSQCDPNNKLSCTLKSGVFSQNAPAPPMPWITAPRQKRVCVPGTAQ